MLELVMFSVSYSRNLSSLDIVTTWVENEAAALVIASQQKLRLERVAGNTLGMKPIKELDCGNGSGADSSVDLSHGARVAQRYKECVRRVLAMEGGPAALFEKVLVVEDQRGFLLLCVKPPHSAVIRCRKEGM